MDDLSFSIPDTSSQPQWQSQSPEWYSTDLPSHSFAFGATPFDDFASASTKFFHSFDHPEGASTTNSPTSHDDMRTAERNSFNSSVGMTESQLALTTNKSLIVLRLKFIYKHSWENISPFLVKEGTCPYESKALHIIRSSAECGSSSTNMTLYHRVHRLDAAFSFLRKHPLTKAEEDGSSRALKLAIMAFGSQWSASSLLPLRRSSSFLGSSANPAHLANLDVVFRDERSEISEFEELLRLNLWNQTDRCLKRWSGCGSFRICLAKLIFGTVQRPVTEDEMHGLQSHWIETTARSNRTVDVSGSSHDPANQSSNVMDCLLSFTASPTFSELTGTNSRSESIHSVFVQLLHWKRKIESFVDRLRRNGFSSEQLPLWMTRKEILEECSSFNLIFWQGVIFDSMLSGLREIPYAIPEASTNFIALDLFDVEENYERGSANEELLKDIPPERFVRPADSSHLWGFYLIETRKPYEDAFGFSSSELSERVEAFISDTVPICALAWRNLGHLQTMVAFQSPASTIEHAISTAIHLFQWFDLTYGNFYKKFVEKLPDLPFKHQARFTTPTVHLFLGFLKTAYCIEAIDKRNMSTVLQREFRSSSSLVLEMKKKCALTIAKIASFCCVCFHRNVEDSSSREFHDVIRNGPSLADPLVEFTTVGILLASNTLLDWLRSSHPAQMSSNAETYWLEQNVTRRELIKYAFSCAEALKISGTMCYMAKITSRLLSAELSAMNMTEYYT